MPKVLLVEDNEANRDMLSRRLQRRGYEVFFASNGAEGVSKTLSDKPDLVLMDINLPGMNGWEATKQLKANPQSQHIPVIALTAYAMDTDREQALTAGFDDYDTKPIDLPRLLTKIETLLQTKSPRLSPSIPQDSRIQRALLLRLRSEFGSPLHTIIGYTQLLLDELSSQPDSTLCSDLQKILVCATQMLELVNFLLNPVQLQTEQLNLNSHSFAAAIRLTLLTPLSTVLGYCEMLLEEAAAELPDLEHINTAAGQLLSMINDITNLTAQQLQAIDLNSLEPPDRMWDLATSLEQQSVTSVAQQSILVVHQPTDGLLKRQLERQGYTVATATNPALALSMLQAKPYDLLLLDVLLPGGQGLELLAQLKRHPDWCELPVLVLASDQQIAEVVRYIELGAQDYLSQPFQPVLLRRKIAACLEHKRLQNQQRYSEEKYRQLWENAPQGIYHSTLDGQLLSVNPAMARLHGYEPADMLAASKDPEQIYVDRKRRDELRRLVAQQGGVREFEYQVYRPDGEMIWLAESACLVADSSGQLSYQGVVQEITPRKLAEAEHKRQVEQLQFELEQLQRARQPREVTQGDYFQQLKAEVELSSHNGAASANSAPRVLLVEDNEMNRDMLRRRLLRSGYQVEIAVDGAEGVAKTAAEQPDLVLMDMNLPAIDGWEATKQLKANPQTRNIPIIALTAHAMAGDRETALAAGCDDYDTKPIELPRLLSKIKNLLQKAKSYR